MRGFSPELPSAQMLNLLANKSIRFADNESSDVSDDSWKEDETTKPKMRKRTESSLNLAKTLHLTPAQSNAKI